MAKRRIHRRVIRGIHRRVIRGKRAYMACTPMLRVTGYTSIAAHRRPEDHGLLLSTLSTLSTPSTRRRTR